MTDSELEEFESIAEQICNTEGEVSEELLTRYFEMLRWIRDEELSDEVWNAKFLIVNEEIEPDIFNSYEWVNNCVEQLKDPTHPLLFADVYPSSVTEPIASPDDAIGLNIIDDYDQGVWTLERYQGDLSNEAWNATEDDPLYKKTPVYPSPVELLVADIRRGVPPAPELLLSLGKAFDLYFSCGGELTLEEVFFGRHKAKDIRANRRRSTFKGISFQEFEYNVRRGGSESLEDLALIFITNHKNENPESRLIPENVSAFLKKYYRWRAAEGLVPATDS